jgi:hypothetical protein
MATKQPFKTNSTATAKAGLALALDYSQGIDNVDF